MCIFWLKEAKFGSKLERIEGRVFCGCPSLERITIPLKNGVITDDDVFMECRVFKIIALIERTLLHETIAALHLEDWRNDLSVEIDSINHLPTVDAGRSDDDDEDEGEKAQAIRTWIRSVLRKIVHYKAEHQRIMDEVGSLLCLTLTNCDE